MCEIRSVPALADLLVEHRALFVPDPTDPEVVVATPLARGPWDEHALHGGAVAALLARAAEQTDPGPASFVTRITCELYRPVPLAMLRVRAQTVRPGRSVQWIAVEVRDATDRVVAAAHALRVERTEAARFDVGDGAVPTGVEMMRPVDDCPPQPIGLLDRVGFWSACELRLASGTWMEPGPGAAWIRLAAPVVPGEEPTPTQRLCAAADFGSGVGNPVRGAGAGAINAELTVHQHRPVQGVWVGLDSRAWAHAEGGGLTETLLFDGFGPVGRGTQAMVLLHTTPWVETSDGARAE